MHPGKPGVVRGRVSGGVRRFLGGNPAGQGEQSGILGRLSFSEWFSHPVVESGRKWVKVVESGRKWGNRGEAKAHRDHPGWFSAVRAPLGSPLRSTCAYPHLPAYTRTSAHTLP